MISGNSVVLQMGKETTYGTSASATKQIKISSESLRPTYNKVSEGLGTGGRGEGLLATMGIGLEGTVSTLLRPDMGYILAGILGAEGTVSTPTSGKGHTHTFTCIASDPSNHLPSYTFKVNRGVDAFAYTGCKINRLSLSASAGDFVKADFDIVGKDESSGATMQSLTPSTLKAFKFAQGKVYNGSSEIADITNINIEINNNCDAQTQTTDTGNYYKEPEVGMRSCSITLDAIYSTDTESLRESYYKSDNTLSLKVEFTSDEEIESTESYKMTITIPCCQMSDASANMSDPGSSLSQSMTLNAVDNLTDEFIKIELTNNDSAKYI